ncbi:hypothetical protein R1flu_019213 [Riccia fluitans]|uniref:tRNA ligase phosphodiesterase domain-containing protein n=1 Tax=Riccia fluitans TaxID=41844 RepID=A0ABD1ZIC8_9MARC
MLGQNLIAIGDSTLEMRALLAVKGRICICIKSLTHHRPEHAASKNCHPLNFQALGCSTIFRVMEAGKNVQGSNANSKRPYNAVTNKNGGQKLVWAPKGQKPEVEAKSAVKSSEDADVKVPSKPDGEVVESKTSKGGKLTARAQVRATFYPKFENEKSDQEVRNKMIHAVTAGNGVVEVSLKHSGSLFLYSGDTVGGAFAKNSYGNLYTAVGVFVLGRTMQEAWGAQAAQKQKEFNAYLQENKLSIAMELVTAVLGDHGQRPLQDYVVVTAVTKLQGRPLFYSSQDVVAFCHEWRLPTNNLWLFSSKKSAMSFFSAYDALCEEGIASTVTKVMDEIADMSVPGTKNHRDLQGEILEGLVARVVDPGSVASMEKTLREHPAPAKPDGPINLGPALREIFAANRESEEKQMRALLQAVGKDMCSNMSDWFDEKTLNVQSSKGPETHLIGSFLQASPADDSTLKLQELCRAIRARKLPVRFKCRSNAHRKTGAAENPDLISFRMTIHVLSDSAFRRYQNEMRKQPGLWPLYRGFFVDIELSPGAPGSGPVAAVNEAKEKLEDSSDQFTPSKVGLEQGTMFDDTEHLMLKLKFLPYKLRTFLIRNGLAALMNKGVSEYKTYYMRQMKNWGTSAQKQKELTQLLDEWATVAKKHFKDKKLHNSYLTVAEPFLEKYAQRNAKNQRLIGAAGSAVNVEQFLAEVSGERSEEEDDSNHMEDEAPSTSAVTDASLVKKAKGMLVFFPGIPGCAKSGLCAEIRKVTDLGAQHHLMGDTTKGRYWQLLADQRKKKPQVITLADKNAPNEEVWKQIENMCESTQAVSVPVVCDSEGTESNPYSLDALAVFAYRVLQRVDHPGKLDKNSPNPGFVLLMFYNLYKGKDRKEFEEELQERFGHLVKMPLLKANREPLPKAIVDVFEQGLDLYKKHTSKHGRMESFKGSFKDAWAVWEALLRSTLFAHTEYLNTIQVPFQEAVKSVIDQLKAINKAGLIMHVPKGHEERTFRTFTYCAVKLPQEEVSKALESISAQNPQVHNYLNGKSWKENLGKAHITLAHKHAHGVAAVSAYGSFRGSPAPVQVTALVFSDKLCALEVQLNAGSEEQTVKSLNAWPHVTIWTGQGLKAKDANALPALVDKGQAQRIVFPNPIAINGTVEFL